MLCVTGNEPTLGQLSTRLKTVACRRERAVEGLLQEVRLDALRQPLEDAFGLLEAFAPQLVVCCRAEREGGAYRGSEAERLAILQRAAASGVAYVDVEADCPQVEVERVAEAGPAKLVLSWHDFAQIPADLEARAKAMGQRGADVVKVAVGVDDAAEVGRLLTLQQQIDGVCLVIGMGLPGLVTRCRYRQFGSPWTYVKAEADAETAPGQLSLDQALSMGLPDSAASPFAALVGGPQVVHSAGSRVYNRLFRSWGQPWSYLPVCTRRGQETFALLRRLGAMGLSVTMPCKDDALAYAGDGADEQAREARAVNSLRFTDGAIAGTNTDIVGVARPLAEVMQQVGLRQGRALILGAGGAARAAVLGCRSLGLWVTVSARRRQRAAALGDLGVAVAPWELRHEVTAEVLINATSVSGEQSVWPAGAALNKRVVFDLAITGAPSRLLQRALKEGARAIEAIEMWLAQGAAQISWITSRSCTAEALRGWI